MNAILVSGSEVRSPAFGASTKTPSRGKRFRNDTLRVDRDSTGQMLGSAENRWLIRNEQAAIRPLARCVYESYEQRRHGQRDHHGTDH